MPQFANEGLHLAFLDEGPSNAPVVLCVHGFASNRNVNWIGPGWIDTLTKAGFRVLALDNRGHGESDKPHDPAAYTPQKMAGDVIALLDQLQLPYAHLFGYSMGARICAFAALDHPARVRRLILGGLGMGMVEGVGEWDPIAEALLAPSLDDVTHARGRMFRAFADQTGSDRIALAACIQTSRTLLTPEQMGTIRAPALIGVGTNDDIAGAPEPLAAMMADGRPFAIERRDHMLAVGDRTFKTAVLEFLAEDAAA